MEGNKRKIRKEENKERRGEKYVDLIWFQAVVSQIVVTIQKREGVETECL
jgi:hypothetical protein